VVALLIQSLPKQLRPAERESDPTWLERLPRMSNARGSPHRTEKSELETIEEVVEQDTATIDNTHLVPGTLGSPTQTML
jgi:uncharacterized protein (UPF0216 family)